MNKIIEKDGKINIEKQGKTIAENVANAKKEGKNAYSYRIGKKLFLTQPHGKPREVEKILLWLKQDVFVYKKGDKAIFYQGGNEREIDQETLNNLIKIKENADD